MNAELAKLIEEHPDLARSILLGAKAAITERLVPSETAEALDCVIDELDQECGNPNGSCDDTEITEGMRTAALTFAQAVLQEYIPWACEPTGEVISWTREMAEAEDAKA